MCNREFKCFGETARIDAVQVNAFFQVIGIERNGMRA